MKDFFILWGMLTGSFMLVVYSLMVLLALAASFVVWGLEPVYYGLSQLDWASFRVTLCVSAFVSFFIALSVCSE